MPCYECNDLDMYGQLNDLKNTNPDLKTLLAVGGWEGSEKFPQMVGSKANRTMFIYSVIT